MEQYGPIKNVKMIVDRGGKPRGYAFVEFEREDDMTSAYRRADGKKIDGRRIVVDVERGRTVRNWRWISVLPQCNYFYLSLFVSKTTSIWWRSWGKKRFEEQEVSRG